MTHPIVEGLTEAITMTKLMRENERLKEFNAGLAQESFELQRQLAEERALCADLDGGLKIALDIIGEASRQLTEKSGTKWGLWYIDRISDLRQAYRKARGM